MEMRTVKNQKPNRILSAVSSVGTFANYTFREMISNRILILIVMFALLGLGLAGFITEVAVTEHKETQLAIVAAVFRFCAVFIMMVFVVSSIVREFNDKCLELYLSMPVSRTVFFVGKIAGFILCGLILSMIFSAVMLLFADLIDIALWGLSLTMELAIVATFAFFAVLSFNQQVTAAVFITFFFYLMSRLTDTIELISNSPALFETLGNNILEFVLWILKLVLPPMVNFTKTDWLVYGSDYSELPGLIFTTVVYCLLIGAMAMWDFVRKNL